LDEEKRKQIESTIMAAFDRWSIRNNEKYIQEQKVPGKQREESGERARQDGLFLTKRVFAPGFDRYIVKVLLSNPVVRNQRRVMLKASLVSIIKQEGVKTEEVIKRSPEASSSDLGGDINATQYVARRQFQRYRHEEFKEMVFPITDDTRTRRIIDDDRFAIFSTVFAPRPLPKNEDSEEAEAYLELDRIKSASDPDAMKRIILDSLLRLVTPDYVEGLLEFQKECLELLREIGAHGEVASILMEELSKFSLSLGVFYAHFQSMLGVQWYRRQKPKKKKELMARGFPLHYSKKDADRIAPLLVALMGSEERACLVMLDGANCLFEYNVDKSHDYLVNKCLSMPKVPKLMQATIAENAAFFYRNRENYERMLHYAKIGKALSADAKDYYLAGICFRDMGEAEWQIGRHEKSIKSLSRAEKVGLEHLDGPRTFGIYFNLAFGCRRMKNEALELEYLKRALKFAGDTDRVDSVLKMDRRLDELLHR
jgi:tetratricopeptide (TPR) repeat protein